MISSHLISWGLRACIIFRDTKNGSSFYREPRRLIGGKWWRERRWRERVSWKDGGGRGWRERRWRERGGGRGTKKLGTHSLTYLTSQVHQARLEEIGLVYPNYCKSFDYLCAAQRIRISRGSLPDYL
jgi:hypothetical protein